MQIVLDIVAPVFGLMAFGYAATFTRVFDQGAAKALAGFVFHFALPVMLFRSMARAEAPEAGAVGHLATFYLGVLAVFLLGMAVARFGFAMKADERAIFGFGASFGNTVLLGIPLVLTSFGEAASFPLFLIISFHSLIFFTLVTVLVEVARGSREGLRALPLNVAKSLAGNVILMSLLAGMVFNRLGLVLPGAIDHWAELVAGAAVPCALFATGAALRQFEIKGALSRAFSMLALKCLVHPLIVFVLATFVFALPHDWMRVAVVLAAMPVGVNPYLFATKYQIGEAEVTTAILISTPLSVITLSVVLALLGAG